MSGGRINALTAARKEALIGRARGKKSPHPTGYLPAGERLRRLKGPPGACRGAQAELRGAQRRGGSRRDRGRRGGRPGRAVARHRGRPMMHWNPGAPESRDLVLRLSAGGVTRDPCDPCLQGRACVTAQDHQDVRTHPWRRRGREADPAGAARYHSPPEPGLRRHAAVNRFAIAYTGRGLGAAVSHGGLDRYVVPAGRCKRRSTATVDQSSGPCTVKSRRPGSIRLQHR